MFESLSTFNNSHESPRTQQQVLGSKFEHINDESGNFSAILSNFILVFLQFFKNKFNEFCIEKKLIVKKFVGIFCYVEQFMNLNSYSI